MSIKPSLKAFGAAAVMAILFAVLPLVLISKDAFDLEVRTAPWRTHAGQVGTQVIREDEDHPFPGFSFFLVSGTSGKACRDQECGRDKEDRFIHNSYFLQIYS